MTRKHVCRLQFRHSGKLGDIIYALPTIRALDGGTLFINAGSELSRDAATSILSLLECQPYIERVQLWNGESFDVDLDAFRSNHPLRKNLADAHLTAFGLQPVFRDERWLELPRLFKVVDQPKVIFSRTITRPGPHGFWKIIVSLVGNDAAFVGTDEEYQDFCDRYGAVRRQPISTLLDLAKLIDGANLFVGNQSCPYAIAEGLKKAAILEVDASQPNCLFGRSDALQVVSTGDLSKIESFLRHVWPDANADNGTDSSTLIKQESAQKHRSEPDYYGNANHRLLERVSPTARRILDIGCARGRLGALLKQQNPSREVWGIELVPSVAQEAMDHLDHVLVGDIEKMDPLSFAEKFFDCVICGDVLEHMRRPEDVLSRLKKHLCKEATLICSLPNIAHWSVLLQLLQGEFRYDDKGLLDRTHLTFFTPRTFKRMLWDSGFVVCDEESFDIPNERVLSVLERAAMALGIDSNRARASCAAYQTVFTATQQPNPYEDPEKMKILLGPHVGELGPPRGKRCSVVVLTYNSEKTLDECLDSVIQTLGQDDELICVDNASHDRTQEMLREYADRCDKIKLIFNDDNLGFSTGCNAGMLASDGEFIILLNPDTRVWAEWIDRMLARFSIDNVGAVGPVSDRITGDQFVSFHLPAEQRPQELEQVQLLLRENGGKSVETRLLIGFCLALPRYVLDQFGLLVDEMFLGSDDLEISWRLRTFGLRLLVATDVFVHHETGASQKSVNYDSRLMLSLESAFVLKRKMESYYGLDAEIDSKTVWGNDIFPFA